MTDCFFSRAHRCFSFSLLLLKINKVFKQKEERKYASARCGARAGRRCQSAPLTPRPEGGLGGGERPGPSGSSTSVASVARITSLLLSRCPKATSAPWAYWALLDASSGCAGADPIPKDCGSCSFLAFVRAQLLPLAGNLCFLPSVGPEPMRSWVP